MQSITKGRKGRKESERGNLKVRTDAKTLVAIKDNSHS
jgi:hypothetical protein